MTQASHSLLRSNSDELPTNAEEGTAGDGGSTVGMTSARDTATHLDRDSLLLDGVNGDSDAEQPPQHVRLQRTPVWGASVNSIAFMCVPRTVPACFAKTGWPLGILSLAYSSVVTYDTGMLLGVVCNELPPDVCSFPALASEAAGRCAARYGRNPSSQVRWRRVGEFVVGALQYTCYYLTGVAELIYFEQFCGQLFATSMLCQWQWLLVVGALCIPVLQVPSFHATRFAALVFGVLPLILNVSVFLYEIALVHPWDCKPGPSYTVWPDPGKATIGLTAFAYAFGGHGLYPEQIREMAQPTRWPQVMRATYATALPLYWLCGLLGYAAYGDFAMANINLNFPDNAANRLSIGVQALQEFFFVLDSNLVVMLAVELSVGLDPAACVAPKWKNYLPPWVGRLGLRTVFLATQIFCAQMLLSGEGDTLLALQSLTASIGMVAFTYFLPYVFHAILSPTPLSTTRKVWASLNVILGLLMMVSGFSSSLYELTHGQQGLFDGQCEIPYKYAPLSPSDPCNISGLPPFDDGFGP